ncbi:MAG: hypothetical protein OEY79_03110 [Anaplasmataceae bacterium]|nr:hypothetical protein [Anaplasmataceae bacterium]
MQHVDITYYRLMLQYERYKFIELLPKIECDELKHQYSINSEEESFDRVLNAKNETNEIISKCITKLKVTFKNTSNIIQYLVSQKKDKDSITIKLIDTIILRIENGENGKVILTRENIIIDTDNGENIPNNEEEIRRYIAALSKQITNTHKKQKEIDRTNKIKLEENNKAIEELKKELKEKIKSNFDYDIDIEKFLLWHPLVPNYLKLLEVHDAILALHIRREEESTLRSAETNETKKQSIILKLSKRGAALISAIASKAMTTTESLKLNIDQNSLLAALNLKITCLSSYQMLCMHHAVFVNSLNAQSSLFNELKLVIPESKISLEKIKEIKQQLQAYLQKTETLYYCTLEEDINASIERLNALYKNNNALQCNIAIYEKQTKERKQQLETTPIPQSTQSSPLLNQLRRGSMPNTNGKVAPQLQLSEKDNTANSLQIPRLQPPNDSDDISKILNELKEDKQNNQPEPSGTNAQIADKEIPTEMMPLNAKIILIMTFSIFVSLPLLIISLIKKIKKSEEENRDTNNKSIFNITNNIIQIFLLGITLYIWLSLLINNNAFKLITLDKLFPIVKSETYKKIITSIIAIVFLMLFSTLCNLSTDLIITKPPENAMQAMSIDASKATS